MEIIFTDHALEMIAERNANRKLIEAAMKGNINSIKQQSLQKSEIGILTIKDSHGKHWSIIHCENRVVTVHRAHKPEEKRYEETFAKKN